MIPRHFTSRSGRTRVIRWSKLGLIGLGSACFAILLFSALVLYTPALHWLAGDWTGAQTSRYFDKLANDLSAGAVNALVAPEPDPDLPEGNWLPTKAGLPFSLTFRTYVPKDVVKTGAWFVPAVELAD